ncbi:MAG: hypothetical protein AAF938_30785, partial [Myxococcota bacterium]
RAHGDDQLHRLRAEAASLREAVVSASQTVDESRRAADAAEQALVALRAEHASANAAASDAAASDSAEVEARAAAQEAALGEAKEVAAASAEKVQALEAQLAEQKSAASSELSAEQARREEAEAASEALRKDAAASGERLSSLRTSLLEARRALDVLQPSSASRSTQITAVGVEAPDTADDPKMAPQGADDTLLRSLTAQLEERDDRIRALERKLDGATGDGSTDALELEERVERLREALSHERSAREAADERVVQLLKDSRASGSEAELSAELARRQAELTAAVEKRQTLEVDVDSLRGVCERTREGLESLLADADADEEAARRIGSLLDILSGY